VKFHTNIVFVGEDTDILGKEKRFDVKKVEKSVAFS